MKGPLGGYHFLGRARNAPPLNAAMLGSDASRLQLCSSSAQLPTSQPIRRSSPSAVGIIPPDTAIGTDTYSESCETPGPPYRVGVGDVLTGLDEVGPLNL